jgi:hypothetical protein
MAFIKLTIGLPSQDGETMESTWPIYINVDCLVCFCPIIPEVTTTVKAWSGGTSIQVGNDHFFALENPETVAKLINSTGFGIIKNQTS